MQVWTHIHIASLVLIGQVLLLLMQITIYYANMFMDGHGLRSHTVTCDTLRNPI